MSTIGARGTVQAVCALLTHYRKEEDRPGCCSKQTVIRNTGRSQDIHDNSTRETSHNNHSSLTQVTSDTAFQCASLTLKLMQAASHNQPPAFQTSVEPCASRTPFPVAAMQGFLNDEATAAAASPPPHHSTAQHTAQHTAHSTQRTAHHSTQHTA